MKKAKEHLKHFLKQRCKRIYYIREAKTGFYKREHSENKKNFLELNIYIIYIKKRQKFIYI